MGQWQVGASSPGACAEVLLALATVGARGVVFTLTLQAALAHRAQVGMQVALTPEETRGWESGQQGSGQASGTLVKSRALEQEWPGVCWDVLGGALPVARCTLRLSFCTESRLPLPWFGDLSQPGEL